MTFLQQQALMLMQALLGVISPNFRIVSISDIEKSIIIRIVLEKDSIDDREEINDLTAEFEALQSHHVDFEINVEISEKELHWPDESTIVVFRRKEI